MKSKNITQIICRIFYILFAFVFAMIALAALFCTQRTPEEYVYTIRPSRTIIFCIAWGVLFLAAEFVIKRLGAFIEKRFVVIIGVMCAVYFAASLMIGFNLRVTPLYDAEAVFEGAKQITLTGALGSYEGYYYIRPNNIGAAVMFAALFKIFGVDNAEAVYITLNAICLALSLLMLALSAKMLMGKKRAVFAALLMLCCLPLYGYAAIYYTDILAMPFALGSVYFYCLACHNEQGKKLAFLIISALCIGLGMSIKFTVIIAAIAIVIHAALQCNLKQLAATLLILVAAIGACQMINSACTNALLPDAERLHNEQLPYTHWPMMGLAGDGRWNNADEVFSASFDTYEQAAAADLEVIKQRLSDYGVTGTLALIGRKSMYTFADGTLNMASMVDDGPVNASPLHTFVLYTSPQFVLWFYISTAYLIIMYIAAAASAAYDAVKNAKPAIKFLIRLCFFGLWAFLMMWESNSRYLVHFMPMLILSASFLPNIFAKCAPLKHKKP